MGFTVKLVTEEVSVDPGGSVPVAFECLNTGSQSDRFEMTVEGVDHEWVVVPVPAFVADPGDGRTERFFLRPPRESHSTAGNYPFVLRVRSLETGESSAVQGVLEVRSYTHLSVDVQPRKVAVSPLRRTADLQVNVANLGNTTQTLQLFAADTDDVIGFDFGQDQLRVDPGQQASVPLVATATTSPFLANPRLQPVTVSARSVSSPAVGATTNIQVEQRGLLSIANAVFLMVAFLLAVGWYVTQPKPPRVATLVLSPMNPTAGSLVTVRWTASDANSVELNVGGKLMDKQPVTGEYQFTPEAPGKVTISALAVSDTRRSAAEVQVIDVLPKVVSPDPVILSFSATTSTAPVGQSIQLNYQVNESVTALSLSPLGVALDPRGAGYLLRGDKPGSQVLKLIARNSEGKVAEQELSVKFVVVSKSSIESFEVSPTEVGSLGGNVTVRWATKNSFGSQLSYGDQKVALATQDGETTVMVTTDTTFTLSAVDDQGVAVSKRITVKVKSAEAPSEGTDHTLKTAPEKAPPTKGTIPHDPPPGTGKMGGG